MHAGAHVRAIAESQVIRGSPLQVEAFKFLPLALVAIGGRIEQRQKTPFAAHP